MKELTITVDDDVYDVLHPMVKDQTISNFIRVKTVGGLIYPPKGSRERLKKLIERLDQAPPMFVGVDAEAIRELNRQV
jgi:DNA-directed RNA polymerase subunit L